MIPYQKDMWKVKELKKNSKRNIESFLFLFFSKLKYKDKVEINLFVGNAKDAWKGLNTMMGRNQQQKPLTSVDLSALANYLNRFYARFDTQDFSDECNTLCQSLISCPVNVDEGDVVKCLSRINTRKVPGSDGLRGRVLKVCAEHLGRVFTHMFQLFLNRHFIPHSWKMSTVTPVPRRPGAKEMNDFRPVAPISITAKCMERIVCNQLIASVTNRMDPLQFAYRARRGEDATLTLFDLISNHPDSAGTTVRVLCMDFSSAFNTIQPHVLIKIKNKKRLLDLEVNTDLVLWIIEFLHDRPQCVCLNSGLCDQLVLSEELGFKHWCSSRVRPLSCLIFCLYK